MSDETSLESRLLQRLPSTVEEAEILQAEKKELKKSDLKSRTKKATQPTFPVLPPVSKKRKITTEVKAQDSRIEEMLMLNDHPLFSETLADLKLDVKKMLKMTEDELTVLYKQVNKRLDVSDTNKMLDMIMQSGMEGVEMGMSMFNVNVSSPHSLTQSCFTNKFWVKRWERVKIAYFLGNLPEMNPLISFGMSTASIFSGVVKQNAQELDKLFEVGEDEKKTLRRKNKKQEIGI